MLKVNYAAVRAFMRIATPKYRALEEGYEADRQFDGGEFSCRWYAEEQGTVSDDAARIVGERFGIDADDVLSMVYIASNEQCNREFDAAIRSAGK
jgi:hypothetical protein